MMMRIKQWVVFLCILMGACFSEQDASNRPPKKSPDHEVAKSPSSDRSLWDTLLPVETFLLGGILSYLLFGGSKGGQGQSSHQNTGNKRQNLFARTFTTPFKKVEKGIFQIRVPQQGGDATCGWHAIANVLALSKLVLNQEHPIQDFDELDAILWEGKKFQALSREFYKNEKVQNWEEDVPLAQAFIDRTIENNIFLPLFSYQSDVQYQTVTYAVTPEHLRAIQAQRLANENKPDREQEWGMLTHFFSGHAGVMPELQLGEEDYKKLSEQIPEGVLFELDNEVRQRAEDNKALVAWDTQPMKPIFGKLIQDNNLRGIKLLLNGANWQPSEKNAKIKENVQKAFSELEKKRDKSKPLAEAEGIQAIIDVIPDTMPFELSNAVKQVAEDKKMLLAWDTKPMRPILEKLIRDNNLREIKLLLSDFNWQPTSGDHENVKENVQKAFGELEKKRDGSKPFDGTKGYLSLIDMIPEHMPFELGVGAKEQAEGKDKEHLFRWEGQPVKTILGELISHKEWKTIRTLFESENWKPTAAENQKLKAKLAKAISDEEKKKQQVYTDDKIKKAIQDNPVVTFLVHQPGHWVSFAVVRFGKDIQIYYMDSLNSALSKGNPFITHIRDLDKETFPVPVQKRTKPRPKSRTF